MVAQEPSKLIVRVRILYAAPAQREPEMSFEVYWDRDRFALHFVDVQPIGEGSWL